MIIFSLLQPLVMLLLFSQIFASIARTGARRFDIGGFVVPAPI